MFSKNLYFASGLNGIRFLLINLTYLFLPVYLYEIGITGFRMGVLLSMFFITGILFSPGMGILTDRQQVKKLIAIGSVFCCIFYGTVSFSEYFPLLFIIFLLGGLGNSIHEVSIMSVVMKSLSETKPGTSIGAYSIIAITLSCIGTMLAGFFLDAWHFKPVFYLSSIVFLLLPLLAVPIVQNTCISAISEYTHDFLKKDVIFFLIAVFFFVTHWGAEQTCLALYMKTFLGLSNTGTGIFIGTVVLFLAISALIVGIMLDRGLEVKKIIIPGLLCSGIGNTAFFVNDIFIVYSFRIIHEIGDGIMQIFLFIGISRLFPKKRIGGLAATVSAVLIIGRFAGALIYSTVGKEFGYEVSIIASGIATLLIIPFMMLSFRQFKFIENNENNY
jgi:MFS family permease